MTSQVNVDTIAKKDGTGSVATEYVTGGSAKAWARMDQTVPELKDSLNVGSLVDNSTGDFSVNFASSFGNADYSFTFGIGDTSTGINKFVGPQNAPTTSVFRFDSQNSSAGQQDRELVGVTFHGSLA